MMTDSRISTPGLYDLTADEYHGDCCVEPSISKTGLTLLLHRPAKFWASAPFNPQAVPQKGKKAWDLGSAVHELILYGEHEFRLRNTVLPKGVTKAHREGKAVKAAAEKTGQRILSHGENETIRAMHRAFEADPLASVPFRRGLPERSLIWPDEETGVWLKVRPDFLPDRIGIVPEYKSVRDAGPSAFKRDVLNFGYHLQAALYLQGIQTVLGEVPDDFVFVCQEKEPPYLIELYSLEDEWLELAQLQLRRAIRLFADCLEKDCWPGSTGEVQPLGLSYNAHKALEEERVIANFGEAA